jgi:Ni/Co efflux regulator RcnB
MKKLLIALLATAFVGTAFAEAELKEVCHDKVDKAGNPVMDKKTGKQAQDCKKIKVHKKLEGTEIPTDPKKK